MRPRRRRTADRDCCSRLQEGSSRHAAAASCRCSPVSSITRPAACAAAVSAVLCHTLTTTPPTRTARRPPSAALGRSVAAAAVSSAAAAAGLLRPATGGCVALHCGAVLATFILSQNGEAQQHGSQPALPQGHLTNRRAHGHIRWIRSRAPLPDPITVAGATAAICAPVAVVCAQWCAHGLPLNEQRSRGADGVAGGADGCADAAGPSQFGLCAHCWRYPRTCISMISFCFSPLSMVSSPGP